MGYLYIIGGGKNTYKIGITKSDPYRRLSQLQTGNDRKLTLERFYRRKDYKQLERKLHTKFKQHRLHGEWFNVELRQITSEIERGQMKYVAWLTMVVQALVVLTGIVIILDAVFNNSGFLSFVIDYIYWRFV